MAHHKAHRVRVKTAMAVIPVAEVKGRVMAAETILAMAVEMAPEMGAAIPAMVAVTVLVMAEAIPAMAAATVLAMAVAAPVMAVVITPVTGAVKAPAKGVMALVRVAAKAETVPERAAAKE